MKLKTLLSAECVERVSDATGCPAVVVDVVLKAYLAEIFKGLTSNKNVSLGMVGRLKLRQRAARIARNPRRPGDEYVIPEHWWVVFRPSKQLKNELISLPVNPGQDPALQQIERNLLAKEQSA